MEHIDGVESMDLQYDFSIDEGSLLQGAEGRILSCVYLGKKAILKERFSKKYRHPDLDRTLTKDRMKGELKGIMRCMELPDVRVPRAYFVNAEKSQIILERIEGIPVRVFINRHHDDAQNTEVKVTLTNLGHRIGKTISIIHKAGVVHGKLYFEAILQCSLGDLTTSNMMLENEDPEKLVMIDFGLASANPTPEDKGVDLYVLERAILSTHPFAEYLFDAILEGYKENGEKQFKVVNTKLDEIRMRGRKREMVG
ncbi:hypothetical protein L596_013029 [Steinernema carpocapsae]|uniref:non-specific serine/threonine protein kinase n=1 Tax=Steinernema carpocapsae TaxID=34508 RepID=A0A4U5NZF7_STECR|nr:hypothetical protein L596_013029 [Steinernema carpocapsae]